MNRQSQKKNGTNFIKPTIIALFVTVMSTSAHAQSIASDSSGKEIAVQYLGSQQDMMLVGVKYNNVTDSKFMLSIYNQDGEVVFRNTYASKDFDKKFKIPKDHGEVNFVFTGIQEKLSRTYTIHNTSRVVADMVVTKMK